MPSQTQEFVTSLQPMQPTESRGQLKRNLAAEVLRTAGKFRLAAFGYSMLPTLWPGEILTIQAQTLEQVQPSEVVLFSREGRFFIHRVVRKVKTGPEARLITRGDALPAVDATVFPIEFLGKIVSVRRGDRDIPVPACPAWRRFMGLALTYSVHLRSLGMRWHAWWSAVSRAKSRLATEHT
jgi:hypothetical protein